MADNTHFAGTTAVVTGASSGIGRAVAIELARRGAERIVVHYRRNRSGAEQTKTALTDLGCVATTTAADLSSPDDVNRFVQSTWQTLGSVQTWINNAGADVLTGDAAALPFEDKLCRLLEVDVVGTIRLSRLVAERMCEQSSTMIPSMTFIGWDQASHGMDGEAGQVFGPVKAAVMAFANSLAQSVAPSVRVNTVAPAGSKPPGDKRRATIGTRVRKDKL